MEPDRGSDSAFGRGVVITSDCVAVDTAIGVASCEITAGNEAVARDFKTFIYGGTGMYPGRGFTHFDFGPLRSWVGS